MSGTTCSISIMQKNNKIKTIKANYNGELLYSGKILNNFFNSIKEVKNLIKKGNISGLHEENNSSNKKKAIVFNNKKEYMEENKYNNFNYLFKEEDETWYLVKRNGLKKLSDFIT